MGCNDLASEFPCFQLALAVTECSGCLTKAARMLVPNSELRIHLNCRRLCRGSRSSRFCVAAMAESSAGNSLQGGCDNPERDQRKQS